MRQLSVLVVMTGLTVAGCEREASFDDRYEAAEKEIRGKASEIDRELEQSGEGRSDGGKTVS